HRHLRAAQHPRPGGGLLLRAPHRGPGHRGRPVGGRHLPVHGAEPVTVIDIEVDISDVDNELARLEHGFARDDLLRFEGVLVGQFSGTQAYVHVITGSLRASGKPDTHANRHEFRGEISYGGAAPGWPHDPVDYAIYERARGLNQYSR